MSSILCIVDGMTDETFRADEFPNLSSMHLLREMQTTPQGYETESLNCIMTLLGVKQIPRMVRGYVEALGAGITVAPKDLVLRLSWYSVDEEGACTMPTQAPEQLDAGEGIAYYCLGDYKSVLVFSGMGEEIEHIVTYPPYQCAGRLAESFCPEGSEKLRAFFHSQHTLSRCAIPWGQARYVQVEPFPQPCAVVSGTNTMKGIAALLGMENIHLPGATGDVDTDLKGKVEAALKAAETTDFVVLHFNGTDEAGHRRNVAEKRQFTRQIDGLVLPKLLSSGHRVYVTSDHATEPRTGVHVGTLQPLYGNVKQLPFFLSGL